MLKQLKKYIGIFLLFLIFLIIGCSNELPIQLYRQGDVVCHKLNNNLKGIIILSQKEGYVYKVRFYIDKNNNISIGGQGLISGGNANSSPFIIDWFEEYELSKCE